MDPGAQQLRGTDLPDVGAGDLNLDAGSDSDAIENRLCRPTANVSVVRVVAEVDELLGCQGRVFGWRATGREDSRPCPLYAAPPIAGEHAALS